MTKNSGPVQGIVQGAALRALAALCGLALLAGSPAFSATGSSILVEGRVGASGAANPIVLASADSSVARPGSADASWCLPCPHPPIPIPTPGKDTGVLALRRTEVRANVVGPVAEVEVVQHYHNPARVPITVGYTFPLPGDASVRALDVVTGDRRLRGEVREVEEARRLFEEASQAGHGAVLVEERRSNVFRARIANVEPGAEIAVRIRYVQTLGWSAGGLRLLFPTVVAPRYCPANLADRDLFDLPYVPSGLPGHAIDIRVRIAGSPLSVASPSHPIRVSTVSGATEVELGRASEMPNRDFILAWKPAPHAGEGAAVGGAESEPEAELWVGDRTDAGVPFLLVAWPPRRAAAPNEGREVVFILDSSGSMSGTKWATAVRAVKGFLRGLGTRDTIRLVEFDNDWNELDPRALPFGQATLDRADAWLDGLRADGGTEILRPLEAMLRRPRDPERSRIVVLLTDGQVGNEAEVRAAVRAHGAGTRIFTLGIDYAVNDAMLRDVARLTNASCLLLTPDEDVEGAILTLTRRFSSPVLGDLRIQEPELRHFPARLPDLYVGEPLVVGGWIRGSVPARVTVTGREGREAWRAELQPRRVSGSGIDLAAVAAKAEIQELIDGGAATGENEERPARDEAAIRRAVVPIALAHGLSSPWTAFVVVERRDERTETGLVREVEVPVAFPHGWNWEPVFGPGRTGYANGGARPSLARAAGALFQAAIPMASPMAYAGKSDEGLAPADAAVVSPEILARRYLVRQQRADGFWQVNGADDPRTTAVAILGLLSDPGVYAVAIERASQALASRDLSAADPLTRALVQVALERASAELGEPAWAAAAAKIGAAPPSLSAQELSRLGASDDAESLATLVLAAARNLSGAESGRTLAATRLVGRVERGGSLAGVVSVDGRPSLFLTASAAALAR